MTECQGCGAWNDASRTVCVLCGTPLAEIDEWEATADPPPLPPLPDGGLASAMPSWLREPPAAVAAAIPVHPSVTAAPEPPPLGPVADPRTFLTDDDFPQWLHDLAARQKEQFTLEPDGGIAPLLRSTEAIAALPAAEIDAPLPNNGAADSVPVPAEPAPATTPTSRNADVPPPRDPWVSALLVLLFLSIIAAALWALLANGVFGPGW